MCLKSALPDPESPKLSSLGKVQITGEAPFQSQMITITQRYLAESSWYFFTGDR